jgi:hypothetical protein
MIAGQIVRVAVTGPPADEPGSGCGALGSARRCRRKGEQKDCEKMCFESRRAGDGIHIMTFA